MAGVSKAEREARKLSLQAVAQADEVPSADPGLVKMQKHGDELSVHPSCVAAHELVGWTVVESK